MSIRSVRCIVSLAIASVSLAACVKLRSGRIDEEKASTTKAIDELHARFNGSQFDKIYDNSCPAYRKSRKRDDAVGAMKLTQQQFGAFREITHSEMNVIVGAPVQVRAIYNSNFDKGPATELFGFLLDEEGNPQLAEYHIYPGTMVPKAE
jgi:hypothetical protein